MVPLWLIMMTVVVINCDASRPKLKPSRIASYINERRCRRPHWLNDGNDTRLIISGFFPQTGGDEAISWGYETMIRPAVELALEDIKNHPCILKGYTLDIEYKDTECQPSKGMKTLFETMDSETPKLAVYGGACTTVNEPLAMTTNYFHMVQVSYAETHPKFTIDKDAYSYFYRMVPSYRNIFITRVQLLRHFNWTRVGIIVQRDDSRYALPQEEVQNALETKLGIKVNVVGFSSSKLNMAKGLVSLKKSDARIILGFFNSSVAAHVFCEALKQKLIGPMHVWILSSFIDEFWWHNNTSNCTNEEFVHSINNHFLINYVSFRSDNDSIISGKTIEHYKNKLTTKCRLENCRQSAYQGYIYDGVWTIALALERIIVEHANAQWISSRVKFDPKIHIEWRNHETQKLWGQRLLSSLNATNFQGITGLVRFENNERLGTIRIAQFQGDKYVTVGEDDTANDIDTFYINDSLLQWAGDSVPKDSIESRIVRRYVDFAVFCIMSVLTGLGMVVAMCFLIVNVSFRNHKFIKMSSPNMNNLIVVGSLLMYLSVVLVGLDTRIVSQNVYGYLCTAKLWTLSVGFTLAFGSMFSKTWRVHSIFTNIKLHKKVIKDYKLFIMVIVLLLIDIIILIIWLIIDPMQWTEVRLPIETYASLNLRIDPRIENCKSEFMHYFQGVLISFKGLLLISGCFLAWETRHVNVPALNDSKYIGMSVYNVVVMCSLGVPISFILKDNVNASYILISIFVIFCTTLTLFLVFIPKVVELARNPKNGAQRYRQTFLKSVGANLQRGPSADSAEDLHEELHRVEQDNEVWRKIVEERNREIVDLLKELAKLGEQMCILPSLENTSISRVSHSSIPEDPFGGVYLGGPSSGPPNSKTESTICSGPKATVVEDISEKTSLLATNQFANHRPEKRGTSLKFSKIRPSLSRFSVENSLIIENDMLTNAPPPAMYHSIMSADDDMIAPARRPKDNLPKDLHFSFISYIDSVRSDDGMSTSRTLPSIKESYIGTSRASINDANGSVRSKSSANSGISEDSFFSTVSSIKSNLIYLSVFGDYESNEWINERAHPSHSITQETWLTVSDDTITPATTGAQSRIMSRDISRELDRDITCLDVDHLAAKHSTTVRFDSSLDTMSTSSSVQSLTRQNKKSDTEMISEQQSKDNKSLTPISRLQKKRDRFRWLEKLAGRISRDSTDSHTDEDNAQNLESKPVPAHLLQHRGPECPFIVGTKDFELYAKFVDEKPEKNNN